MSKILLQINVTANWGSTGKIAEEIGKLAMKNGWRSVIAYGRNVRPSENELIRIGSDWYVKEHVLESRLLDRHGLASRLPTKRFIKLIDELKPDIVHLHNIHGYYLNYKLLFEYLTREKIPIVWTLHDCWPFTGHCGYFDLVDCERWQVGCSAPCPCKKSYPTSLLLDRCEKNWKQKNAAFSSVRNMTLVPVSKWLGRLVKLSFLGEYPERIIYNGIDVDLFRPQEIVPFLPGMDRVKGRKIVLGVASIWDRRKGLNDFVRLRELLSDEFLIVLVGVSEEQMQSLPCGVIGVRRTQNQQELAQLYSIAEVFVNPTYEDNFPTTNLEALSCGTPVITYRTGGSPESIDEETGAVVEQGDIEAVVSAINRFTKLDRYTLSITCRKRALKLFDAKNAFAQYISLYNMLAEGLDLR